MMRKWAVIVLVLAGVSGCSLQAPPGGGDTGTITPQQQAIVNLGLRLTAGIGCAFIGPTDRKVACDCLGAVEAAIALDPSKGLLMIEQLAGNPGPAQVWAVIHSTLDDPLLLKALRDAGLTNWTDDLWWQVVGGGLGSAVAGCKASLQCQVVRGGGVSLFPHPRVDGTGNESAGRTGST